jgi:hypothetical protein
VTTKICTHGHLYQGKSCPECETRSRPKPNDPMRRIRGMKSWQQTRRAVLERDGHQCTFGLYDGDDARGLPIDEHGPLPGARRCAARRRLDAHHIEPIRELLERHGDPFDPQGCRTLCSDHHNALDAARRRRLRDEEDVPEFADPR